MLFFFLLLTLPVVLISFDRTPKCLDDVFILSVARWPSSVIGEENRL